MTRLFQPGDRIRLKNRVQNWDDYSLIMTIDEVKPWGVVCYQDQAQGRLYYRATWDQFELVSPWRTN